ncbi:QueT transporter family protein [Niallia nealsonii]|uniref:QueT transporter family protein n=1 Tax=Niallia nealsonii TaxID=115979 RepID=A0A2N0Z0N5_9BACI|nr:QueT transporter family protein [Niallia nealsonii]PKG23070.1 hypothetical protein CWS01_14105 [Niallia nealsonii]
MKIKTIVINAMIAALYIAVTGLIAPFGFTNIQFRISEMFNHLIVFNKKYLYGIVIGVFLANLFFSPLKPDMIFGPAQSIIALLITIFVSRYVKNIIKRMVVNTLVFTFTMSIIALELYLYSDLGISFLTLWFTTAVGEFAVMAISIPIIYLVNKRVHFDKVIKN